MDSKYRCHRCDQEKPESEFSPKRVGSQRPVQYWCKPCAVEYTREDYRKNADRYKRNAAKFHARKQKMLIDLKDGPCTDCGGRFPHPAMEWDHVDADTKVDNISRMLRRRVRLETVLAEIEKCDLVCANCHRIRTHERNGGDSRWLAVVDEEDAVNPPRRRRTFR